MAMVTESASGEGVAFMPFHFGGHMQGEDLREPSIRKGADPLRIWAKRPIRRRPTATTR